MLEFLQTVTTTFADWAWGPWLLVLLLGGGVFFLLYSRLLPFRYLGHAVALLRGKYDDPNDPGHVNHRRALSAALAGTIGMGNIAGVALAIKIGGPGAIFWMWITALVGMGIKFFTCSLAVMYRGKDSNGVIQGGPMYVIREALPKRVHFLAYLFAGVGMIGSLPALQSNQLVQIVRDLVLVEYGVLAPTTEPFVYNLVTGIALAALTAAVVVGGITRIARVAGALVPTMSVIYIGGALLAIVLNLELVPGAFALIFQDAFTGEAAAGGSLLFVILYGVRRGAFSNEAGMGTESMAHGAARTREPVREGLVAMLGPVIDTLFICTATALMIILSGVWQTDGAEGVTLTANAFASLLGPFGLLIVFASVLCFATTTIFTYAFYGSQCASFTFGANSIRRYQLVYVAFILIAAVVSVDTAISLIDGCFALMAIPTMVSALWLAPQVMQAARKYFKKLEEANEPIQTA